MDGNGIIYTKEQQGYVAGVPDKDLRAHLLHQTRLRDLMEEERDRWGKYGNEQKETVIKLRQRVKELEASPHGYIELSSHNRLLAKKDEEIAATTDRLAGYIQGNLIKHNALARIKGITVEEIRGHCYAQPSLVIAQAIHKLYQEALGKAPDKAVEDTKPEYHGGKG